MIVSLIAAVADNGVIGRDGGLPWRLSADLKRFKQLTMGKCLVMGRRTYESVGRPLPGRTSIVVTRDPEWKAVPEVLVAHSLDEALGLAKGEEVFLAGGESVYEEGLTRADRLYLTHVHAEVEGDTRFPEVDLDHWRVVREERHEADDRNAFAQTFRVYERSAALSRPPGV